MNIKAKILNGYYTTQTGYTMFSWIAGMITSASVLVLAVHFIIPSAPSYVATLGIPIGGILFFLVSGHLSLKTGAYRASQSFGGRKNPARLNWEMEVSKASLTIEECNLLMSLAKKENIDTKVMETRIGELKSIKASMEEMLGIK